MNPMNQRHQKRVKPWMVLVGGFSLVKLMGAFVPPPQAVPVRCPPRLGARGIGHVVGSCIMAAPAYASDTSGRDFQQFVDDVGRNRDFFISVASAAFAFGQLVAAFKASPEGKIQEALAKTMEPFEPSRPQDEVIQRPVMETLRQRIASWQQHATIIGGRYQSGKSVATEEALRGVRGVVRFTIRSADWADRMCKQLGVDDEGLFKEVMRRVPEKLKDFPNNLTKFPILLLEVPRTTTEGINLISSTAKDVATDKIGSAIHVIVSASSAAVALAFDAGGTERQEDIWVGDLTEEEAKEFLALHGHEKNWKDFVDACGFRIGDLAKACENLKKGISLNDTKQEYRRFATAEAVGFMELQVHPKLNGRQMSQELLKVYPEGMPEVFNSIRILPRELAALIRNKSCHAVYFHPIKKRFFFASTLHKEAAEAQLANP
ncbi:unnamed protein product [Effrenium voratum]|uniref:Uncharacterized protein n=1 Tax=Effrenium voratum TaxID=2562239 RepID=A0AA36ICU4_9DINO|nr:unnamed protein product [Effrenium voratum]CAJ1425250.1 unnamed protein product [Effrenium voratum]